jgi:hypothetical protein
MEDLVSKKRKIRDSDDEASEVEGPTWEEMEEAANRPNNPPPETACKETSETKKEAKVMYFVANDKTVAVFDAADLLEHSTVLKELCTSDSQKEREQSPLPINIRTSRNIHRSLVLLSTLTASRELSKEDVGTLDDAVTLAYNLGISSGILANLCFAIGDRSDSFPEKWEINLAFKLMSAWYRLVDPMALETRDLRKSGKVKASKMVSLIEVIWDRKYVCSPEEDELVCTVSVLADAPIYKSNLRNVPICTADARAVLLDPMVWSPPKKALQRVVFNGGPSLRLVCNQDCFTNEFIDVDVEMKENYCLTLIEVLNWIHDEAFVGFTKTDGPFVFTQGRERLHIEIVDLFLEETQERYSPFQYFIRFAAGIAVASQSPACAGSHRLRLAVVDTESCARFASNGYSALDNRLRRFDASKWEQKELFSKLISHSNGKPVTVKDSRYDQDSREPILLLPAQFVRSAARAYGDILVESESDDDNEGDCSKEQKKFISYLMRRSEEFVNSMTKSCMSL